MYWHANLQSVFHNLVKHRLRSLRQLLLLTPVMTVTVTTYWWIHNIFWGTDCILQNRSWQNSNMRNQQNLHANTQSNRLTNSTRKLKHTHTVWHTDFTSGSSDSLWIDNAPFQTRSSYLFRSINKTSTDLERRAHLIWILCVTQEWFGVGWGWGGISHWWLFHRSWLTTGILLPCWEAEVGTVYLGLYKYHATHPLTTHHATPVWLKHRLSASDHEGLDQLQKGFHHISLHTLCYAHLEKYSCLCIL